MAWLYCLDQFRGCPTCDHVHKEPGHYHTCNHSRSFGMTCRNWYFCVGMMDMTLLQISQLGQFEKRTLTQWIMLADSCEGKLGGGAIRCSFGFSEQSWSKAEPYTVTCIKGSFCKTVECLSSSLSLQWGEEREKAKQMALQWGIVEGISGTQKWPKSKAHLLLTLTTIRNRMMNRKKELKQNHKKLILPIRGTLMDPI